MSKNLRGVYVRSAITGSIIRIMGEAGGHEFATHWGREPCGDGSAVFLDPAETHWHIMTVGDTCPLCGVASTVPLEIHKCLPDDRLLHCARAVVGYDWSESDDDAVEAIDALRTAVRNMEATK
jgi:hypothetical protein